MERKSLYSGGNGTAKFYNLSKFFSNIKKGFFLIKCNIFLNVKAIYEYITRAVSLAVKKHVGISIRFFLNQSLSIFSILFDSNTLSTKL